MNYLLESDAALEIFAAIEDLPIVDYHSHLEADDLLADEPFEDMAALWLGGDHYKWRLMRAGGVPEYLVTGDGEPYAKFEAFCTVLEKAVGNPVYEWSHLELQRYFGIDLDINADNAPEIWERANALLPELTPLKILTASKVEVAVTTDDPTSDLTAHEQLQAKGLRVLPGFRPDSYLADADIASRLEIEERMAYFDARGCKTIDFGLDNFHFDTPQARLVVEMLGMARELGWSAQIHFGAARRQNLPGTRALGSNVGFDSIGTQADIANHIRLLIQATHSFGMLPNLTLYPLNPADWPLIASLVGDFQGEARLQLGAAWWFNDHYEGIRQQLDVYATQGLLGNFTGMLTDSRSLLSYSRHEYFRRILAQHLADWHRVGRVRDLEALKKTAMGVAYSNAKGYFGF